jgi:hypothetical protein
MNVSRVTIRGRGSPYLRQRQNRMLLEELNVAYAEPPRRWRSACGRRGAAGRRKVAADGNLTRRYLLGRLERLGRDSWFRHPHVVVQNNVFNRSRSIRWSFVSSRQT